MLAGTAAPQVYKYQFDEFELLPRQLQLFRGADRIALPPKPLATLLLLVEHAGETVTKEDLFAQVWNGAEVEENNLTQSISAVRKALGEKRGENRYIATEPGRGYRFVAPVSRVIGEVELETAPATPVPEVRRNRTTLAIFAGAAAVLIAGAVWFWNRGAVARPPTRQSVAVLPMRDLSKGSAEAWVETALAEMLTSELAAGGKLRTVPAEDVARWRADLGAAGDRESQGTMLRSARDNLQADTFVVGSYLVTGACPQCRIRVDLALLRARTGERVGTVIDEAPASELPELATRIGHKFRVELGLRTDTYVSSPWPAAGAMREYSEGLAALRRGDPLAAQGHLESASAADPQNPLVHSALAEVWTALGYIVRANEEDQRANQLADSLDRLNRLGVEARYRASVKDWNRAIEIYQTIFKLFPDSLGDGLNLARAQWRAQRVADAVGTLNQLRRLPKPAGNDPRIDLNEAQAVGTLNDFGRTKALAHRAAEEAKARGARYVFARARLLEGGAMQSTGDLSGLAVQDEARRTCEAIGDRACVASAWRIRGNRLYTSGDFQGAQDAYSQGAAIARDLGNRVELANLLVGLAVVEKANREWQPSERDLQEAVALRIETGFNPDDVRNNLAELYLDMGRLEDAEKVLSAERKATEQSGAHEDFGTLLLLEARLARLRGRLASADTLCGRAVGEMRQAGDPFTVTLALAEMSSIYTAEGKLADAEKALGEAGSGKWPEDQGEVRLARAALWMAQGRSSDAAAKAGEAAAAFDKARLDDRAVRAFVTMAEAWKSAGHGAEATAACAEAGKRAALTPNPYAGALARTCAGKASVDRAR
ncbi:MAG TPA: winged helix-turn-helix domain-containing protein [Bryobacteraceae bacterium]|nr:winged helix-turn-helix domain-containing protein [Bryobacteraceae bacterium]